MRPIQEAKYNAAPLPKHRIKVIGGEQHIMLDQKAVTGSKIIVRRKIGRIASGTIMKVTDHGDRGVQAVEHEGQLPFPLDHGEYRVLRKMTEPRTLPVTTYGHGHSMMLESEGLPTFNEIYDHTVIDLTSIEANKGHTLVLKLPDNQFVTICPMYNNGATMVDIAHHGNLKQEMLTFDGPGVPTRKTADIYCLDIRAGKEAQTS